MSYIVYGSDLGNTIIRHEEEPAPHSTVAVWAKLYHGTKDICEIVEKAFKLGYQAAEVGWED